MKALGRIIFIALLGFIGWMGYRYVTQVPNWDFGVSALLPDAFHQPNQNSDGSGNAPETMPCPDCQGKGSVTCTAKGCDHGRIPCPGPCLKVSVGKWEKLTVAGHGPDELWQVFRFNGGWQAWTQAHVGEVIDMSSGMPVNIGKCKVCNGEAFVDCPVCQGKGTVVCKTCDGSKVVPIKKEDPTPPVTAAPEPASLPAIPETSSAPASTAPAAPVPAPQSIPPPVPEVAPTPSAPPVKHPNPNFH